MGCGQSNEQVRAELAQFKTNFLDQKDSEISDKAFTRVHQKRWENQMSDGARTRELSEKFFEYHRNLQGDNRYDPKMLCTVSWYMCRVFYLWKGWIHFYNKRSGILKSVTSTSFESGFLILDVTDMNYYRLISGKPPDGYWFDMREINYKMKLADDYEKEQFGIALADCANPAMLIIHNIYEPGTTRLWVSLPIPRQIKQTRDEAICKREKLIKLIMVRKKVNMPITNKIGSYLFGFRLPY